MARVNHKLVKQRLNEKRSKIRDNQFFSSRLLAGHFEDMAAAQTRRYNYNRRVRVNLYWKPKDDFTAHTDNMQVRINTGHKLITSTKGRENRYWLVCGMFAHELGHILYTDFLALQTYHASFEGYRWYPSVPTARNSVELNNSKDIIEYIRLDKKNLDALNYMAHQLFNILEDGYVENRMLNNFPGSLGYGLSKFRDKHRNSIPTVSDMIDEEDSGERHIFETIMQLILSYAKFGEIKYGDEPLSDERIKTVFELITDIDAALLSTSCKDRINTVNIILIRCWHYIKELCEIYKQAQQDAETSGGSGSLGDTVGKVRKTIVGSTAGVSGNSTPVPDSLSDKTIASVTKESRDKTKEDANGAEEDDTGSEKDNDGTSAESKDNSTLPSGSASSSGKQNVSSEEGGRIEKQQTEDVYIPTEGGIEKDDNYERDMYEKAASDIERILDNMAEKTACKELENERLAELNDAAQSISYGDIHSGVKILVSRIDEVDDELVEQYNEIAPRLLTISKQLQRSIIKNLKESRKGGKQVGLYMGRKLNSHALHRNDGKVFYKNALPNEIPQLAVGLLLDESGSMSNCDRATYARASAIILYDFCQCLDIPITVYGHSTNWRDDSVNLFSYAEFESIDRDDKYRMMDISARGNNRDGAALRFIADRLSKRPEEIKILILVSDGQPADIGYYGSAAEEDLRGIKQEYKRKGILFVAAAIGNDKDAIERIYGDSFLDITDLTQLPVKLTNIVKRHIRV